MNCAQDMGLICDLERGQCRVQVSKNALILKIVFSRVCREYLCRRSSLLPTTRCILRGPDCTGQLQCNSLNNACVECSADSIAQWYL